jgi:biotin operon repressor
VGETTLSFASVTLANSNLKDSFTQSSLANKPFGIEIGFTTDNVEATLELAVKAGATILEDPKTKPWGQVVAYIRDLDGFLIEICTPMGQKCKEVKAKTFVSLNLCTLEKNLQKKKMDETPKRFDRIVAILIQLQSKKIVKAQELADRFEVSLRTIYRDIRTLEASGVPIYSEAAVGYALMEGYRLPPVMFTREEVSSFIAA